jgi:3-hydroxyisobutyrate dehydrogenase-like beta-hydroxyacid dehydrogenase
MKNTGIGFLHPGNMGISLAAAVQKNGYTAYWLPEGRSRATSERAEEHGLSAAASLEEMCAVCSIIISVCPPHAARETAVRVSELSYKGLYADVNAISPAHAIELADLCAGSGTEFVDGGIIGGPAWERGGTWLYLSGRKAGQVADCFKDTAMLTDVMGDQAGKASALKMCYAANTKGTTALLCAVTAAADGLGVWKELQTQWERENPGKAAAITGNVRGVTAKAWRFAGEMLEIAETVESVGIPGGFHRAAETIYSRLSGFRGAEETPGLEEVICALRSPEKSAGPGL